MAEKARIKNVAGAAAEGFRDGVKSAIQTVKPLKLSHVSIMGAWFANKGFPSIFLLDSEGKGKEVLKTEDGIESSNALKWEMKGETLIITTYADREYVHNVTTHFELGGFWTELEGDWYQCYPLR